MEKVHNQQYNILSSKINKKIMPAPKQGHKKEIQRKLVSNKTPEQVDSDNKEVEKYYQNPNRGYTNNFLHT